MTIKNAKIISWVLLILLCSFRITHLVYAVDTVLEVGIPGVPGAEPGAPVSGIVQYISFLYTFVLGFVAIAGFASIVFWGAVWTASGVVDQKSRALEGIKNALYGIGIAFTAFIILNTINPDLTVIKLPAIPGINIQAAISPAYDATGYERMTLENNGISANINYCKDFGDPLPAPCMSCTTLAQLPGNALNGLIAMNKDCQIMDSSCKIFITGGTERTCHTSHGPGIAVVDIGKNTALDKYIYAQSMGPNNFTLIVINGKQYKRYTDLKTGIKYLDEINHWHIVF